MKPEFSVGTGVHTDPADFQADAGARAPMAPAWESASGIAEPHSARTRG